MHINVVCMHQLGNESGVNWIPGFQENCSMFLRQTISKSA